MLVSAAFEAALNRAPLETSLGLLVRAATSELGGDARAGFYIANSERTELHHVVGMSPAYAAAVEGFKIGPESIACGLASHSGRPVITADVAEDPQWVPWRWLADKFGYRACWSFPINTAKGIFVGTFACYWPEPHRPASEELNIVGEITQAAAIIIARHHDTVLRNRAEAAWRESEQRIGKLVELMPAAVFTCDAEGRLTFFNRRAAELWGREPQLLDEHEKFCGSFRMWMPDGAPLTHDRCPMAEAVLNGRSARNMEVVMEQPSGSRIVTQVHIDPLYDDDGRLTGAINVFQDVTECKRSELALAASESQLRVLVAELQHRTRNLIAVVRSMASQTMAQTGPTEAFREEFNDRLEALARVQGLLSRSDEEPVTIESVIRMEIEALGLHNGGNGPIALAGPPVRLRSSIVQTFALGIHELATNALKHGALSREGGRLTVSWRVLDANGQGRRLALEWTETGANWTIATAGVHRGYGRELIERALPYALGAETSYELRAEGVRCTIDMPLDRKELRGAPV